MKKISCIIITLITVVLLASCATKAPTSIQRKIAANVPKELKKLIMEAPDDVFIGVGSAKMSTVPMSINTATTRARADISRQVNSVIQRMVVNYTDGSNASSEDKILFTETITIQTSNVTLEGDALVVLGIVEEGGYYWTALSIKKESVADQISHIISEKVVNVPAMSSFDAKTHFNNAFGVTFDAELGAGAR